jgi:hypothetical protein
MGFRWLTDEPKHATQQAPLVLKGDQMQAAAAVTAVFAGQHATATAVLAKPALGDEDGR